MARARKRVDVERLNSPGPVKRRWVPRLRVDSEIVGAFAESFAKFMGTARFLGWMSLIVILWALWNTLAPEGLRFDPYPFIFLTLVLSLQASYAAPLILLAQYRQEARDRIAQENDRKQAAQSRADMDFLAREIASLRMRVGELATRDFIRSELREFLEDLDERQDASLQRREAEETL
ncbi:MAG TPA: DUF1003 domain-containing protein [Propionibacteriaceae bacterium]|nr:DUF1003 domain-containing protein [Propionibacteriaceae bacterium]